jgi:hypothetical protein
MNEILSDFHLITVTSTQNQFGNIASSIFREDENHANISAILQNKTITFPLLMAVHCFVDISHIFRHEVHRGYIDFSSGKFRVPKEPARSSMASGKTLRLPNSNRENQLFCLAGLRRADQDDGSASTGEAFQSLDAAPSVLRHIIIPLQGSLSFDQSRLYQHLGRCDGLRPSLQRSLPREVARSKMGRHEYAFHATWRRRHLY